MVAQTKAYQFSEFGTPDVLHWQTLMLPDPSPGEIQLRHLTIGVNYLDIYHRRGVFAAPQPLPSGLGVEGVGIITAIGRGVVDFAVGQRVAYAGGPPGAYATLRNLPAARAVAVPEGLDSIAVAAMFFKGLTAEYLIHHCVPVARDDTVLFHAAAGGVGSIACQWLHHIGATVIGTVGSAKKVRGAAVNGCDHVIVYTDENFAVCVREMTSGRGVDVVYDSVGATTFAKSLDCLCPRGTLVSFGESSGPVPPLSVASLGAKGSLYVTRPSVAHYTADRGEYDAAAEKLFAAIASGVVKAPSVATYSLSEAPKAHADLEARRTTGSLVLVI